MPSIYMQTLGTNFGRPPGASSVSVIGVAQDNTLQAADLTVSDDLTVTDDQNVTGDVAVTGALTPTGGVAAGGGFSAAPRNIHTGGVGAQVSTDGTDVTPSVTETYIAEVFVPANMTVTGIALMNGSAVAGNIKLALANSSGAVVASTASTAQSGTDAYQRVALSSTYAAKGPATYYVLATFNNTSARFNAHAFGNFGASKKTGEVYGTHTTITPPTTFTADVGPIASLY
jgi:hypothetical protein